MTNRDSIEVLAGLCIGFVIGVILSLGFTAFL